MNHLLAKEHYIKKVSLGLNILWGQLRTLNSKNLHDLSVVSEDFFVAFLNSLNGLQLVNLSTGQSNFPGIDLGDRTNGVCYQITAENSAAKLKKTIKQYTSKNYALDYPHLRILIIGQKSRTGYPKVVAQGVHFSPKSDVIDIADLLTDVSGRSLTALASLCTIMDEQMPLLAAPELRPAPTDIEALTMMRNLFDRPAFHDDWQGERNFNDFQYRMIQLIGLLASGQWENVQKTKGRFEFSDQTWRDGLGDVYHRIRELLQLFVKHTGSGEIDPATNRCQFVDRATNDRFNDMRDAVIDEMNKLLKQAKLPLLQGVQRWPGGN